MAEKLKRQFVLVATSAVFAVLVLVLMLVNRMNYLSLYESSMDTLELITYYGVSAMRRKMWNCRARRAISR